jgi:hypothetical protein
VRQFERRKPAAHEIRNIHITRRLNEQAPPMAAAQ